MRGSSAALVLGTIENASVLRRNSQNTAKDDSKNSKNTPQRTTTAYRIYDKHSVKLSICKGRGKCYEDEDAPPAVFGPQKKANYDAVANESSLQFVSEINTLTNS